MSVRSDQPKGVVMLPQVLRPKDSLVDRKVAGLETICDNAEARVSRRRLAPLGEPGGRAAGTGETKGDEHGRA